jgi:hypothetical protein
LSSDRKTGVPFAHYSGVYDSLDPEEISRRCGLPFDRAASAFTFRILGEEHRALYPGFVLLDSAGETVSNPYENILFIRYLCEGKYFPAREKRLAYNENPWGGVYFRNFESRCLRRCAQSFGGDIPAFKNIFEQNPRLQAEPLPVGDAGYRFEFINGLFISLILWGADDEFPPSAQMLFDDNFVFAFTAEDLAVAGEVLVERLKRLRVTIAAQSVIQCNGGRK